MSENLVWITGAAGLIGNYLATTAARFAPDWEVRGLTRGDLDLLEASAVKNAFERDQPKLIIHCAALSQSPACQQNPALARKMNVEVTAQLAELAAEIPFMFFSTDLVFDGHKGNYEETDEVNPLSVYAETKLAAESIVLTNPRHTVIRTSLNGGISKTRDRGFNEQLRRAFQAGQTVKLFTDEFRCPLAASVTARAVWELCARQATGIYHVAGCERLSRWEIGQLIATRCPELQPKLQAESLTNYSGAPRSPDTSLNCGKAQQLLSFQLPGLSAWLKRDPTEGF